MPAPFLSRALMLAFASGLCTGTAAVPAIVPAPATTASQAMPPAIRQAAAQIRRTLETVQRTPGAFPAVAAVIVHGDDAPWVYVHGRARADRHVPADRRTLFYIASQTKSFMGLLAAILDRKGVLKLDTTLAQVWPGLKLPAPADAGRITMADLLSHQEGLRTDTLNFVTAYVRELPAADYPRLLGREVRARAPGFRYANLGDLIYGAALQARTGRSWRDWLDAEVLGPLKLDQVTSRPSTVAAHRLGWNHQWDGTRWHADPPKPDALMHAAGGLMASPEDMARWMQANLDPAALGGGIAPAAFRVAQQPLAKANLADREIDCNGYSLGWYTCRYKGQRALMHPGAYTGAVSVTVLVPSANAGMSLMVNSDSAAEGLELETMKAFIGLVTAQPGETERLRKVAAAYPERLARKTRQRLAGIAQARAEPGWNGWPWHPTAADLAAFAGHFDNPTFGPLDVRLHDGRLEAQAGALRLSLEPASPGLFGATAGPLEAPAPFRYDAGHRTVRWKDQVFVRAAGDGR